MKYKVKIFAVLAVVTLGVACNSLHPMEEYRETYVAAYCKIFHPNEAEICLNGSSVQVEIPTYIYARRSGALWEPSNKEDDAMVEAYGELSKVYGDSGFNTWCAVDEPSLTSWAFPFEVFDVVSNADYDAAHPAGMSLNDIVEITYTTHKYFIENGYKHTDASRATNDYSGDKVTKKLSELQSEDAIFMEADSFSLRFVEQPTAAQSHTFTVTVEFEHGEPYSFSFDMDFPSAE